MVAEEPGRSGAGAPGGGPRDPDAGQGPRQTPPPDLGAPTTFVLLRHGETALTGGQRFSGSGGSDPVLSEAGWAQAEAAARELAVSAGASGERASGERASGERASGGPGSGSGSGSGATGAGARIDAVVSSPLVRCRQTAGVVADRLGLDVTLEEGLRETDFGAWDGLTFADARQRDPAALDGWLGDPSAAPPGGESFEQVTVRVAAARDALLAAHRGRTVLLVSHVTPIKTLVRLALGAPPEALFRMYLAPASLSGVAYYADGNASVRYVNATAHLRSGSGAA